MSMINPLAKARGHGSAKEGVHHWYAQRASAVLLIFLIGWMIYAIITLAGAEYPVAREFMAQPLHAAFIVVLLITMFYHAVLGLQVVIEDYVHKPAAEIILYFITRAGALIGMALGIIHVLKLALGA